MISERNDQETREAKEVRFKHWFEVVGILADMNEGEKCRNPGVFAYLEPVFLNFIQTSLSHYQQAQANNITEKNEL